MSDVSEPAGWAVARGALDASLKHDDAQLWIVADEAEQVDLELAFLAADRMVRVLEQVLNARQERWLATQPAARVAPPPPRV